MDWWHQAYNIKGGIAVTGNFVDQANLKHVLRRAVDARAVNEVVSILNKVQAKDADLFTTVMEWMVLPVQKEPHIWMEALAKLNQ